MRRSSAHLLAAAAIALCGCERNAVKAAPSGGGGAGGLTGTGGTGGTPPPPPPFDAGINPDAHGSSVNCGAVYRKVAKLLPQILILLDRSGSMNEDVDGTTCSDGGGLGGPGCGSTSKWGLMAPALMQVVTDTDAQVNWGLKFFPDNDEDSCNVSSRAAVPLAAGNANAVTNAIMGATNANGGVMGIESTPIRNAMTGAMNYLLSNNDPNPKFILLATDGLPNCAATGGAMGDDSVGATTAIEGAWLAGFQTFVVGIATSGAKADRTLSAMADAGGLSRTGVTPSYYPVTTGQQLSDAFRTLVTAATTCSFQLGPPPTDDGTTSLERINVFGDGDEIPRDHTHNSGYDYTDVTRQSIQLYGPWCDKLMSGELHEVNVTFRCLLF